MMKKVVLLVTVLFLCTNAFSWGPTGHRATGHVAERYLSKKAKKELERVLKGQSLAIASTWMDEVRSDSTYDYMGDWHWVTIPEGQTYEQSPKNPNGDVIQTLERIIGELEAGVSDPKKEAEYVRILIHLIGDIHQPLHVGTGNDRGGNDVKVMWFRVDSNLHRVWDSDMIDDSKLSYTELAASLGTPSPAQLQAWQKASVREWASESIELRKKAYQYDRTRLGYEYSFKYFDSVRLRLLQAGVRMAAVFNKIYG